MSVILGPDGKPLQRAPVPAAPRPAAPPPAWWAAWRAGFRDRVNVGVEPQQTAKQT